MSELIDLDKIAEDIEVKREAAKERISFIYDELERLEGDLILLEIGSRAYNTKRIKIKELEKEQIELLNILDIKLK